MSSTKGTDTRNTTHPAVKRILKELKEIQECDNPDIAATALEDNIFEWLFVIRGAWGTDYEGGLYHGRILMPAEYPFKPPAFVMLTPSGRFETKTKICLSISSFHPESWQPSWSVQSALVALIAFMQTPGQGAIGSMECSGEMRRQMALESRTCIPQVQSPEKQVVINEMHAAMLEKEASSRASYATMTTTDSSGGTIPEQPHQEDQAGEEIIVDQQEEEPIHRVDANDSTTSSWKAKLLNIIVAALVTWILLRKLRGMILGKTTTYNANNLVDYSVEL